MHNGIPVRYGKPTRRKNSKFPVIMIIIIVIVAILSAVYFVSGIFFNEDKEETKQPTETNKTQVVEEEEPAVDVEEHPVDIPVTPSDETDINDDAADDEADTTDTTDTTDTADAGTPVIPEEDTVTETPEVVPPSSETTEPQPEIDLKDFPAAPDFPGDSTVPAE